MNNFGIYTASSFLAPNPPLSKDIGPIRGYLRVINNSPYLLTVNMGGQGTIFLPEMWLEDIILGPQFTGNVIITPQTNLLNTTQALSNSIALNYYLTNELDHAMSQPLSQNAVNVTASGQPVFNVSVGFGSTTTFNQYLNIFNPVNSNVVMIIHSALAYTNDSTGPTSNLVYISGADLNVGASVTPLSDFGQANPPASKAHCTFVDSSSNLIGSAPSIEVQNQQQNVTQDLKKFPDVFYLFPGGNLVFTVFSGSTGHVVRLTVKWTEVGILAPAVQGVSVGIANELLNTNNPIGSQLILSQPQGAPQALSIFVDGSGVWAVDQSGVAHQVFKFQTSGPPFQLGQAGDEASVEGHLKFYSGNVADSPLIDASVATVAMVLKLLTGSISRISLVGQTTIANGGTAVNHGLGVVPSFVIPVLDAGSAGTADVIKINFGTMTTTQFTAFTTNSVNTGNVRFFVFGS